MNPAPEWAFINNDCIPLEEARIHISDLALQRGYGVFDFFRVKNGRPVWLDDHLTRFFYSANEMHLHCHFSMEELKTKIFYLLEKNNLSNCGIRITLTGGYSPDGITYLDTNLIISAHNYHPPAPALIENGIRLLTHSHQRQLPHVKSIDYLMAFWIQPKLRASGAHEILYHQNGFITECPRANFFVVKNNGKIQTPKMNILPGITRMKLLQMAGKQFEIVEDHLTLDDLKDCTEAFITSTTKGILPVARVDDYSFAAERPVIRQLQQVLNH